MSNGIKNIKNAQNLSNKIKIFQGKELKIKKSQFQPFGYLTANDSYNKVNIMKKG